MAGVTCIYNPQAPATQQVSLFYNTNLNTIALEQRCETKASDARDFTTYAASAPAQPGSVLTSSQLATANLSGVTMVFGITNQYTAPAKGSSKDCGCDNPTQADVSIVSPVYQPITSTDYGQYSLAACASDDTIYVFYLSGASGVTPQLQEETIGNDQATAWSRASGIQAGSSLAAYWDPDSQLRCCIYQAGGNLWEIQSNTTSTNNQLDYPDVDPASPSPLAVVYVPETKSVYLYYRSIDKYLRKVVKQNGQWGQVVDVKKAGNHTVGDDSQLSVTSVNGLNHVFYIAGSTGGGTGKFEHVVDPQ